MKKIVLFGLLAILLVFSVSAQNLPTVTIVNSTGYLVYYVYMSPSDDDHWGSDLLDKNQVLEHGATFTHRLPVPLSTTNVYDISLEDEDGDTYTKFNVTITDNATIVFIFDDIDYDYGESDYGWDYD